MEFPLCPDDRLCLDGFSNVEVEEVILLLGGVPGCFDEFHLVPEEVKVHRETGVELYRQLEVLPLQHFLHGHLVVVHLLFHLINVRLQLLDHFVLP